MQAQLIEQSQDSLWKPITERRVKWLDLERSLNGYLRFSEKAHLQYLRNQLRYNMLVKEAEETERMISDL